MDNPPNSDLYNLDATYGIVAKWPNENVQTSQTPRGEYIGLMQAMTDTDQQNDPNAWNWMTNATDGMNLFSGTPPAEYQDSKNKIQHATDYENQMRAAYTPCPPVMTGNQIENMALVLYGGYSSGALTMQFYMPVCSSPGKVLKTYTCKGATWQWVVNTGNQRNRTFYVGN
ncbi:MAG: hypothetical protein ACREQN_11020, partial [Candidatus Binataceae bacterium]